MYINIVLSKKSKNTNLWNIKKTKYTLKRCIPLKAHTLSKRHEKFAFKKIRTKPTQIAIKSCTLPTISNRLNFVIQFSWMSVFFFAGEDSNLRIVHLKIPV